MIPLAAAQSPDVLSLVVTGAVLFVTTAAAVVIGGRPIGALVARQERQFEAVLRGKLLLNVSPRTATVLAGVGVLLLGGAGYLVTDSGLGAIIGLGVGVFVPSLMLHYLRRRRLRRLEGQLVAGIQTLASGVRAGLNLIQAMQLVARDASVPLRQEFRHLLREYEYGIPLEEAMENAAVRIGSGDFRLLFAALQTHRERGGNLGETLDRIAASIREIQRLESRVKTLTAQGRTTARWLGAMPVVILIILNFVMGDSPIRLLFEDNLGKVIILTIIVLNVAGFLWIRKIVSLDI